MAHLQNLTIKEKREGPLANKRMDSKALILKKEADREASPSGQPERTICGSSSCGRGSEAPEVWA